MKLSVLVVDDEPVARRRLKRLLLKSPDVMVVGECEDGPSAIAAIQRQHLDIVFLDVQMPNLNGFEVVRAVGTERIRALIFVTAFDQFALQAFEAQAIDYLLKPFGEDRVRRALARARAFLNGNEREAFQERLSALLTATAAPQAYCLLVKQADRLVPLKPREIDWVEAEGDYVRIHAGPEGYFVRSTMAQLEKRLAGEGFVRIHRSRLVNFERIKELRPVCQGESVVVLKTGTRLNASQAGLKNLQERFGYVV
jgi:two-component system LytT family response regulator